MSSWSVYSLLGSVLLLLLLVLDCMTPVLSKLQDHQCPWVNISDSNTCDNYVQVPRRSSCMTVIHQGWLRYKQTWSSFLYHDRSKTRCRLTLMFIIIRNVLLHSWTLGRMLKAVDGSDDHFQLSGFRFHSAPNPCWQLLALLCVSATTKIYTKVRLSEILLG